MSKLRKYLSPNPETAWCMYDWANSVFALVITSAIFPVYYENITSSISTVEKINGQELHYITFLGMKFINTALYSYALSLAFLLVAFISPLLSGISDHTGNKKIFMKIFCYTGCIACMTLYFFTEDTLSLGILAFILGAFGFAGSIVFYNAYLTQITTNDRFDKVSARGYSLGYFGSSVLLILILILIKFPQLLFLKDSIHAVRFSFVLTGIWWAGFAQITFYFVPDKPFNSIASRHLVTSGFIKLSEVWTQLKTTHTLKNYLFSFFFTSMGLQTIMYVAVIYGAKIFKLPTDNLVITVLLTQWMGVAGAYTFSGLSGKFGNKISLLFAIFIWTGICFYAYIITAALSFYILAAVVGLVMGGLQSMYRSSFAKLISSYHFNNTSLYSFYDVTEKLAIVIGTFVFGFIEEITGNLRNSALSLSVFFILGALFMVKVKDTKLNPL